MDWQRDIEVLTPLFNRGAYQDTPELRVPSIRGMVRWWFRALGGSIEEEKIAFGGMKNFGRNGDVDASRLVFRVSKIADRRTSTNSPTLPHKHGNQSSPQAAFAPGLKFRLTVFTRFGKLPEPLRTKVENALEVWLLLGALGLRSNRSGGNVWPVGEQTPQTAGDLRRHLDTRCCSWPVYLVSNDLGSDIDQLRAAATDTVNGSEHIFGRAKNGRLASRIKFKIIRLDNRLRLLITAPDERIITEARVALRGHRSMPETWVKIG